MDLARAVGLTVGLQRRMCGLFQRELAAAAGLHPMAVSKIERGTQSDVGVQTLARLGAALCPPLRASELLALAEDLQLRQAQSAQRVR